MMHPFFQNIADTISGKKARDKKLLNETEEKQRRHEERVGDINGYKKLKQGLEQINQQVAGNADLKDWSVVSIITRDLSEVMTDASDRDLVLLYNTSLVKSSYDSLEKLIQHSTRFDWDIYINSCEVCNEFSNLWKKYPEKFDLTKYDRIEEMENVTIDEEPQLSMSKKFYTGQLTGSRGSFPVAYARKPEADKIKYFVGCFEGNKTELLEAVQKTHKNNEHAAAYRLFIEEAEKALLKNAAPAEENTAKLNPVL